MRQILCYKVYLGARLSRHCERSAAIHTCPVITSEAQQSNLAAYRLPRRYAPHKDILGNHHQAKIGLLSS